MAYVGWGSADEDTFTPLNIGQGRCIRPVSYTQWATLSIQVRPSHNRSEGLEKLTKEGVGHAEDSLSDWG